MNKAMLASTISLISGHLTGIAQGLSWYETDMNRAALRSCAEMLEKDSIVLMQIVRDLKTVMEYYEREENT